jgi:hypothetical protein
MLQSKLTLMTQSQSVASSPKIMRGNPTMAAKFAELQQATNDTQ